MTRTDRRFSREIREVVTRAARRPHASRWISGPTPLESVAAPVHRLDQSSRVAELLAETADVRVDRPRVALRPEAPHDVEELGARERLAGVGEQRREQLELERPEQHLRAGRGHALRREFISRVACFTQKPRLAAARAAFTSRVRRASARTRRSSSRTLKGFGT